MKTKTITLLLVLAGALGACKKKRPESIPVPKAEPPAQAAALPSTAPVFDQNPLNAPGNYLKATVGNVKRAKDAKALYEKTAKDRLNSMGLGDTGGN